MFKDIIIMSYRLFIESVEGYISIKPEVTYFSLLLLLILISLCSSYFIRMNKPKFGHRPQKIINPCAKSLLLKVDEVIALIKQPLIKPSPIHNGWNITVPKMVDISKFTDDNYLSWETDRERVKEYIANISSGLYIEHEDISIIPRSIKHCWKANGKESIISLVEWNFSYRKRFSLFKEEEEGVWIAHKGMGTVGTCHILSKTEYQKYLMNVYSMKCNGNCIIRSGAIDSYIRLRQFIQVLMNTIKPNSLQLSFNQRINPLQLSPTIKVCSISLVSTFKFAITEKNIAERQHRLLQEKVWNKMRIEITHLNYQFSLNELFGISIGETTSKDINQIGLYQLIDWFKKDIQCKEDITVLELIKILSGKEKQRAILLRSILDGHEKLITQSRIQELLILCLYLLLSNIVICINCKSGCDRTGMVFALASSLCQILETREEYLEDIVYVILHFDAIGKEIKNDFDTSLNKKEISINEQRELWNQFIINKAANSYSINDKAKYHLIFIELQNCIFGNLIEVGLPITVLSTGVCGFKYGKESSFFKNPHISNGLPFYIISGNKSFSQVTFRKLLVGASNLRGGSD
ncbi:hypothetical protein EHI8A_010210 [Entamoeba histolytica HM-1:IMSS-B]|uniref:Uncharacterized protein n=6 Tax=Entamoeba histolytica TaxID=5759 RepID=C4M7G4_ENTH1|nr:hypothetical protein EHI_158600 [Entamoeba histolytica HM-1:IMSS]EMD45541.1 Hypothetical protein EHI5A_028920 [Entamoeba histolytica KU27]EMH74005.1 hypothetical protein EHI8A_010210 [Entamoeba histolytica HM-1:IMSS-B]EMS13012.1 hypothetical protein KM1_031340 [Entamoeba histolytica HM-3:IMSS]ENY60895.1 hypothetical protein EHI7A_013080 [Entamoeba histolytica HM-1:IMSS-A]GAT97475.1 hypothetical protein CL6EHI_158600 [Entamoeba histolytica]|eukprot:XP_649705.1 hypothetical protein EHI_158600 [Entamoeba histolytica HM-1:IMSS]